MNKLPLYFSICTAALALPASASFLLGFQTDAAGNPTTGNFSGSGVLDSNIVTGGTGFNITGLTDGDVLTTEVKPGTGHVYSGTMNMTSSFSLAGGTADLEFSTAGGAFKGWRIDNLDGVSELKITSVFSDPIHGRTNNLGRRDGWPWGFSTALLAAGTGLDIDNFDITYRISDIYHSDTPTVAGSYTSGMQTTGVTARGSTGWDAAPTITSTDVTFNSADGFTALNTSTSGAGNDNLLVRGFDDDGGTTPTADNLREFYATTFEVCIKPTGTDIDGNAITEFSDDTRFVFSHDGDRELVIPVPEPSSIALLGLAGLALVARRRK